MILINKIKILVLIVFVCNLSNLYADEYDSLKIRFYKTNGKEKLDALYKLVREIKHDHVIEALTYENEAYKLFDEIDYPEAKAKIYSQFAFCYINIADYDKAFNLLKKAYEIAINLEDKSVIAEVENSLGVANYYIGNYSVAAQHLMDAYKIRQNLDNKSDFANTANNLGLVFNQINEYYKAKNYFFNSLKYKEQINDKQGIVRTLTNICDTYLKLNLIDSAKIYFEKGLELSKKINYTSGIAISANLGGRIYTLLNDYDTALNYYLQSLNIYKSRRELNGVLQSANYIAEIYLLNNNQADALKYIDSAFSLKKEIKKEAPFLKTYLLYSKYYVKIRNYQKAYEYFKIYDTIKDSIFDETKTRQIRELSASYELETKQKEIDILKRDKIITQLDNERSLYIKYLLGLGLLVFAIIILSLIIRNNILIKNRKKLEELNKEIITQKNKVDELNKTQNTLFKIIAHDLRNPFNTLIGFSDYLFKKWDDLENDEKKSLTNDINLVARNTYNLLENLLEWASSQNVDSKLMIEEIYVEENIVSVIESMKYIADKKEVSITCEIAEDYCISADKHMLQTILRNLINNAIKYSKKGGNVNINVSKFDEKFISIEIIDDGIGISQEFIDKKLNEINFDTTIGTSGEKGTGLGLMLCKELVSKNKGKFYIESELEKGTKVKLLFLKAGIKE